MKILFLDFDSVLNSQEYRDVHGSSGAGIDRSRLSLIKSIVDATDAKIVLITSLREYWDKNPKKCDYFGKVINDTFAEYGLEIYDKTPVSESGMREDDIRDWICENSGIKNYVAIDDGALFAKFLVGHVVQPKDGIEKEHAKKAVEILNKM